MPTKTHTPDTEKLSENGTAQSIIDRLREKSRLRTKSVYVERWEMDVEIRELSPIEAQEMGKALKEEINAADPDYMLALAELISRSCVEPKFSVADLKLLMAGDMSLEPITYLAQAIADLNRFGERGVKSAGNSFPDTEGRG